MSDRVQLLVVLLCALAVLVVLEVGYPALETFSRLNALEAERDRWQRPSEVIAALDLAPGDIVVDLGCGSGYFTLKESELRLTDFEIVPRQDRFIENESYGENWWLIVAQILIRFRSLTRRI